MSQDPSLERDAEPDADHGAEEPVEDLAEDAAEDAPTGDERVDVALAGLRALADLPVEEHPQVYDRLHAELRAVLDHADGDPAGAPAGGPGVRTAEGTVHHGGPDDEPA